MAFIANNALLDPKSTAVANLTSFHFDQSGQVAKLSDDFMARTGKSLGRSKRDCDFLKGTVVNMTNFDSQEALDESMKASTKHIQENVKEIREKLFKIFENPNEHDLRILREQRIDKRRKAKLDERIKELKPRRDIIRKYVEREKKKIADTTAEKMKEIE